MQKSKAIKVSLKTHVRLRESSFKSKTGMSMLKIVDGLVEKHLSPFMKGK